MKFNAEHFEAECQDYIARLKKVNKRLDWALKLARWAMWANLICAGFNMACGLYKIWGKHK
jgi:hypothetical protein